MNALKHGCRAKTPILPGEDPEVYQDRLDAWLDKFAPGDAVEHYLVERAVHVSWQLDRADRAEVAALVDEIDRQAERHAEKARELGADLFEVPPGPIGGAPIALGLAERTLLSWPFEPEHELHPSNLVARLEATAAGCEWLRGEWADLGAILDAGRTWRPFDRVRAIRLLGKQPLDAIGDEQVLAIYLAGHAMDPEGPDVFAEPMGDLHRPEASSSRERQMARFAAARAEQGPRDAAAARSELRALAAAGMARAEALRGVRATAEASERADIAARLSYNAKVNVEWLHKHQATCSRALFRTFEELRKVRRDGGDGLPMDEPSMEATMTDPIEGAGAPMTPGSGSPEISGGLEVSVRPERLTNRSCEPGTPHPVPLPAAAGRGRTPCGCTERLPLGRADDVLLLPGCRGEGARGADEGSSTSVACAMPMRNAPDSASWAPGPGEVVEPEHLSPTDSEPVAAEPVAGRDATTATNEPSGSAPIATNEANAATDGRPEDGAGTATNEASSGPGAPTATNEASSEDGEIRRTGTGTGIVSQDPPHIFCAIGVDRSGPLGEDEPEARAGSPVGCSASTVTAGPVSG